MGAVIDKGTLDAMLKFQTTLWWNLKGGHGAARTDLLPTTADSSPTATYTNNPSHATFQAIHDANNNNHRRQRRQ